MPPPASFPESSTQQLSSYPLFMHSVAPFLAEHMEPQQFNTLYGLVNRFDMAQANQTIPGRLSIDSHFHAPTASAHYAARQSFNSSRSFNMRGIGEDGVHRANTAPGDASAPPAAASTPKATGKGYDLRTETFPAQSESIHSVGLVHQRLKERGFSSTQERKGSF
ncbi:hypothetical protein PIB30_071033 [Stylosanthes scabra]|uniref:Uncharacterized protein n=1 Tax=Stylosanthes scabra TaxID=79078 RepID=A0ABU6SPM2_9FABA|nr:hypothetical protein [Stylosanthes scabra]